MKKAASILSSRYAVKTKGHDSREDNFFSDENGDPFRNTGNAVIRARSRYFTTPRGEIRSEAENLLDTRSPASFNANNETARHRKIRLANVSHDSFLPGKSFLKEILKFSVSIITIFLFKKRRDNNSSFAFGRNGRIGAAMVLAAWRGGTVCR